MNKIVGNRDRVALFFIPRRAVTTDFAELSKFRKVLFLGAIGFAFISPPVANLHYDCVHNRTCQNSVYDGSAYMSSILDLALGYQRSGEIMAHRFLGDFQDPILDYSFIHFQTFNSDSSGILNDNGKLEVFVPWGSNQDIFNSDIGARTGRESSFGRSGHLFSRYRLRQSIIGLFSGGDSQIMGIIRLFRNLASCC